MNDPRIDPDDLARLADLPPDDPRVKALGPAARASLRAYRDFMTPGEAPEGARVADAERTLLDRLERELGVTIGSESGRTGARPAVAAPGNRPRGWTAWFAPQLRPALGLAAAVIVTGGILLYTASQRGGEILPPPVGEPPVSPGETTPPVSGAPATPQPGTSAPPVETPPVLRGPDGAAGDPLSAVSRPLAGGALRLEWHPTAGATSYRLSFLTPDLTEAGRIEDVAGTHFDLMPGSLPPGLVSGASLLWRVTAMRGADEIARSRTTTINVP